jgi:hypothetical protein
MWRHAELAKHLARSTYGGFGAFADRRKSSATDALAKPAEPGSAGRVRAPPLRVLSSYLSRKAAMEAPTCRFRNRARDGRN